MAIYIDPPRWPAHGTTFSHLISDTSYRELHRFAEGIGLSRRAFDEDHYDVPKRLYCAALAAGAIHVDQTELIGVLRSSGLRVPARERRAKAIPVLRRRWAAIEGADPALGESLLTRWNEPHRHYHTPVHLLEILTALEWLSRQELAGPPPREVVLAAWFHDAVYEGIAGFDEERSADLARDLLPGPRGEEVARLVLLTKKHTTDEDDVPGKLLIDADLAILASPMPRYRRYVHHIRQEYAGVGDSDWRTGRTRILRRFLDAPTIFTLRAATASWAGAARTNMRAELQELIEPSPAKI